MRGEHSPLNWQDHYPLGSSPHARGARSTCLRRRYGAGIIPACAGSTTASCSCPSRRRDHPRMRGEHYTFTISFMFVMGSSPHARGAREIVGQAALAGGIIPACAGSTETSSSSPMSIRDHPRMRGEHMASTPCALILMGSSPHARGAPCVVDHEQGCVGIIPACAGSTLENQRQSLVYAYDSLTFARMQFDNRIAESRKSRSVFRRTASPCGTCSHRSTPSKGDPQGQRHRFRWVEV